ncbi:MAG TPA: response regulator [Chitinophagaceae bacterium]|jgi:CheY-like chemotaxis protein|nr:response regulator [Chitinophagaceae bacterium]
MQKDQNKPFHFILIDDNEIDLFFHEKLIKIQKISDEVTSFTNVIQALEYLSTFKKTGRIYPQTIILLDIQMPELDGFDFLDHFEELSDDIQKKSKIFIVSSSLDHGDLSRSHANHLVEAILKKPLNTGELIEALNALVFR